MKRILINASTSFDLTNEDTQYKVAMWIENYVREEISKKINKRRKKNPRSVWLDDVSWSKDRFYCQVWLDDGSNFGKQLNDFNCRLNFYDAPSESMEDVEYLVKDAVKDYLWGL